MSLYNCKSIATGWRMVKWTDDLEVESIYELAGGHGRIRCACFQANKPTCRHREMLTKFIIKQAVNTPLFYDYDKDIWVQPIDPAQEPSYDAQ